MFRIGEFSKFVKLTVKTLRFYDEVGLLKPALTDEYTGYRYYSTAQLFPLQRIVALREAGFSIEEIKCVLSGQNVDEILERKESELIRQREQVSTRLLRLSSIKKFYWEKQTMNYQAIIKELPEYTVFYKQFVADSYTDYGTIIPQIGEAVIKANPTLKCVEPGFCYVENLDNEYKERDIRAEYAEAVERDGVETEGIRFKKLPPATVACVMHKGSYAGIGTAYAYLINWIETNGCETIGNGREQYIDGCWNRESEDDYLTEIQIPVKAKKSV